MFFLWLKAALKAARSIPSRFRPSNARLIRQYLSSEGLKKLHLGSGKTHVLDGWLNTDVRASNRVAYLDVTQKFSFPDNTFDYVFSEHMIEHIPYNKAIYMLQECFRVLRLGGKLRISTPDFAFLKELHNQEKTELQKAYIAWAIENFFGAVPVPGEMFVINNFFHNWGHQFIYDEITLKNFLMIAGFTNVRRFSVNQSDDKVFYGLENEVRMPAGFVRLESMVLEAVKA